MYSAQQELYTRLLTTLKAHFEPQGYGVYDGFLPPDNTPYPFVYLGDFRQNDTATKNEVIGSVFPQIHVFHSNPFQRGTVSQMLLEIKVILMGISHTDNFAWLSRDITESIIPDNTTKTPLLHGVVEAEMKFS